MRILTAIPVFNEARHLRDVLDEARRYCRHLLIVNDGSTDGTADLLHVLQKEADEPLDVVTHARNQGYGAALRSAFEFTTASGFDVLVTMDCDGQHEPARIPVLLEAIHDADIVSGSRYLRDFRQNTRPPSDRLRINRVITEELNELLGVHLTDAFCGFKAYRQEAVAALNITEPSWGMPLELWVQAVRLGLRIKEVGVPRVYLDPRRAFGGVLNDAEERLAYYRRVMRNSMQATQSTSTTCCDTGNCH